MDRSEPIAHLPLGVDAVSKSNSFALAVVRWPAIWGGLATLGFYAVVHKFFAENALVQRYFASHPVEYLSIAMFFVGVAALVFKGLNVIAQRTQLPSVTLGPIASGGDKVEEAGSLQEKLQEAVGVGSESYLPRRLYEALEFVRRKGSAQGLDEHLRFASDMDAVRMHSSYSFVRTIIWAIPILGFLGTVIGITLAIANLGPNDFENSMPKVILGLQVAFDTTALALALSIVLMFAVYYTDRFESKLLGIVDNKANEELVGRFQDELTETNDPNTAVIRRMAEGVMQSCERLVERQSELWRASMQAAQQQWEQTTAQGGKQLSESLSTALQQGMSAHAVALAKAEQAAAQQARQHWSEMHQAVQKSTDALTQQQAEMSRQAGLLQKTLESVDHVQELEGALNRNLDALANEHNFEETVLSLSAAIQLLTAQLHGGVVTRRKETKAKQTKANAA